ncbi:extracellular matrix regulator RemB [Shouchella lonarensis]|uniref:DUF370 domain-containing protein n=1 Tax=Shouchella lonarensis TaxID=1464122 RepID=A0A1G6NM62_9BACI|nr:DUF370 domain-containing protein [Shouchella lonarensis]SDC68808.1 protein of unknown function [Shouchella lonarensis]
MYLHIGGEVILNTNSIIGFFPYEDSPLPQQTVPVKYTAYTEDESIKTVVVTDTCIYYSPISTQTLARRSYVGSLENVLEDREM